MQVGPKTRLTDDSSFEMSAEVRSVAVPSFVSLNAVAWKSVSATLAFNRNEKYMR